jgi:GT2 family glycosyltransferase
MDVSIIIVNYNTPELTSNCIQSVLNFTKGIEYEIILVDNASTNCDPQEFKHYFPSIKLVLSKKNLGFAGGNNLGIKEAIGRFVLLLNSDTYLQENAILKAYNYIRTRDKVGVVSVRLIFPDGRLQSACQRFPSIKYCLLEMFRVQKILPKKVSGRLLLGSFFKQDENIKVDWVWGTFFMFPKQILSQLKKGELDDSLFMYGEDMQWCWDISKLGYEVHFCSEAEVVHIMGGSNANKSAMMNSNLKKFKKENYSFFYSVVLTLFEKLLTFTSRAAS